jgi:glyoxylase-like metal-dependent hydrolase (beta-lactamase superfamily II)
MWFNKRMIRKTLYTLGALAILTFVGLGILLGPAHLQIRQLDETLPDVAHLMEHDWLSAPDGPVEIRWINTASQQSSFGMIGHVVFVIRWADGRAFLIDAGMDRADAIAFGKPMETVLGADATEVFGPVEEQMTDSINIIKGIGFTHLHSDHTSGITAICSVMKNPATVFQTTHQSDYQNLNTTDGQKFVEEAACTRSILSDELIKSIDGFPGLIAIAAGGHTPGSTIFATRVNGKTWVFAGDITNSKEEMLSDTGKGFAYSYLLVPENTALLGAWRPWLKTVDERPDAQVIISHDINDTRASDLNPW